MQPSITHESVVAFSQCERRAFLILSARLKGSPHEYTKVLQREASANRDAYLRSLAAESFRVETWQERGATPKVDVLLDPVIAFGKLDARCDLLKVVRGRSSRARKKHEPQIIVGTHKVTPEQKMQLSFVGYVMGERKQPRPENGAIVTAERQVRRVRLSPLYAGIPPILETLMKWSSESGTEAPPIILNSHCSLCQFRDHCLRKAEQEDNLSLLHRMTPKIMRKYQKKGIFTVTQLSYLFRPRRRRRKRTRTVQPSFNIGLQALALRTGKIYIQQAPDIPVHPTELFLDIEGVPDRDVDYLIGLTVRDGRNIQHHSFWADSAEEETAIFDRLYSVASQYADAPIYHYGSYEPRALRRLAKRHQEGNDLLGNRLVNVNEFLFAKVYFPTRSNTLKDLGALLGACWSFQGASGLQSLVWRYRWEVTHDPKYRELLVTYNREDCEALQVLTDELRHLGETAEARSDVDFADNPKQSATRAGEDIHRAFKGIVRSAHADYSKKRIRIKQGRTAHTDEKDKPDRPRRRRRRTVPSRIGRVIEVPRRRKCPRCKGEVLCPSRSRAERIITDLDFTRAGCRKTVVKYTGMKARCPRCEQYYHPRAFTRLPGTYLGYRLLAWMCYLRMSLRLPQREIVRLGEDLFGERVSPSWVNGVVEYFASLYSSTERRLLDCIRSSAFVHADETSVNIKGVNHYAWVLTNGKHVIFRLTSTRESGIVKDLLSDYSGILISDFYAGYDSMECRQQKCLVHLIRDLNDDLWSNPYNTEFEDFVSGVKELLIPIFDDVEKYGLKTRHLRKFRRPVDRFYDRHITTHKYACEVTEKYRKRFDRYRDSLFRFFEEDGIPWHNNTAERALRHLAVQRKISGSFGERRMHEYLRLLGISQSCRFQNKSFLKFLLSGEKYVDDFRQGKRLKKARPVCP